MFEKAEGAGTTENRNTGTVSLFVSAKIRHFPAGQQAAARDWITS